MLRNNSYVVKYEVYRDLKRSPAIIEYQFAGVGPRGKIPLLVQFNETENQNIFHLAFGPLLEDGTLDDRVRIGNNDRNKILATIGKAIMEFSEKFPDNAIFFTGSTSARTRLYRMAITANLAELTKEFEIFGGFIDNLQIMYEEFEKQKPYSYLSLIEKNNTLNL